MSSIEQQKADNMMVVINAVSKHKFFNLKDVKVFGELVMKASGASCNNVNSQVQTTLQKLRDDGKIEQLSYKGIVGMYRVL